MESKISKEIQDEKKEKIEPFNSFQRTSAELEYLCFNERAENQEEAKLSLLDQFGKSEKFNTWQAILSSISIITMEQEKLHPMGELIISEEILEVYSKIEFSVEIDELLFQNNNHNASFFHLDSKDSPKKGNRRTTFLKNSMKTSKRLQGNMKFEVNETGFKAARILRNAIGISSEDYLKSINLYDNFQLNLADSKDLKSKSGASFFFTSDHKLVFKSLDNSEYSKWKEMLGSYYNYMVIENSQSLIVKIIGTYEFVFESMPNKYYVVMENINQENIIMGDLISIFDLKGSTEGRTVPGCQEVFKPRLSLAKKCFHSDSDSFKFQEIVKGKDQDAVALEMKLLLPLDLVSLFKSSLKRDSEFLSKHNLMDYSIIYTLSLKKKEIENQGMNLWKRIYSNKKPYLMASYGIVDFLQEYSTTKYLETQFKSLFFASENISCVDPEKYAKRFNNFILGLIASK